MINAPQLKKELEQKHVEFIKKVAGAANKVVADRRFYVQAAMTKITYICQMLVDIGCIDEIRSKPTHSESYSHIELVKSGYIDSIYIMTDGEVIVVENSNFAIYADFMAPYKQKFYMDKGVEGFDWEVFAHSLLSKIHECIYHRKESSLLKFKSDLKIK